MLPLHRLTSPATAPKNPMPQRHQQYGFSLLELVVVMGILAIFSSVSLTFVGEKDVQQRYNESLEKLTMVKRNFLSVDKYQGQTVMHGFFIDNGMIDNENTSEGATEKSFEIILDKKIQDNNHYMPFSFFDSIPVAGVVTISDNGVVTPGGNIIGAGLYKGIRPGAYDLSEYRDGEKQIKDAWGDEYLPDDDGEIYVLKIDLKPEYKIMNNSRKSISVSTSDLVFDVSNLEVSVKDLPIGTFKIALVTFENKPCKDKTKKNPATSDNPTAPDECDEPDEEDYWETIESNELITSPSVNTFFVEEKNKVGLVFNDEDIKNITPPDDAPRPWKLADWTLKTENEMEWKFSARAVPSTFLFTFPSEKISIGTHVVVLLELDTSTTPENWKIYDSDSDPAEDHINHIFEYLNIFLGQSQSSITMSIP